MNTKLEGNHENRGIIVGERAVRDRCAGGRTNCGNVAFGNAEPAECDTRFYDGHAPEHLTGNVINDYGHDRDTNEYDSDAIRLDARRCDDAGFDLDHHRGNRRHEFNPGDISDHNGNGFQYDDSGPCKHCTVPVAHTGAIYWDFARNNQPDEPRH